MRLFYLVAVDVDTAKLTEDRPVQPIAESVRSEIYTNLDSASGALGLDRVVVAEVSKDAAERAAMRDRLTIV